MPVSQFDAAMAGLGPFGPQPRLAVAVSGGADSTALALLCQQWAALRGGVVVALIVDHGLRPTSGAEAMLTCQRLQSRNIQAEIITLSGLPIAHGVQAAARVARYHALCKAARAQGCLFLLLGHHAADQSETVTMRKARGDGGLEGMAGWVARKDVILLRPLLGFAPQALRAFLQREGMGWVEDPSNQNPKFERVRIRQSGEQETAQNPAARRAREDEAAEFLAQKASLWPEGFAVVHANAMPPTALAALLRMVAGADYAPARRQVAALAQNLRPATLGGACVARTAKLGGGWLVAREPAACAPAVPAVRAALWDRRFELQATLLGGDYQFGALGADAAGFRKSSALPALVLRGLPCLRHHGVVFSYPATCRFTPPYPATTHPFPDLDVF